MKADYGRLFVNRVIIHDVPIKPAPLTLSDDVSDLDPASGNYFAERLRKSLLRGFDIEPDSAVQSSIPQLVRDVLQHSVEFVDGSRRIAQHLHTIQKPPNSPGLLVISDVTLEGKPALALLKLERESGMRAEPGTNQAGRKAFQLDVIRSLMFTDTTQVFKAAVMRRKAKTVEGAASDHQAGAAIADIAQFFLVTFLGCRLAKAPEIATRDFFEATQAFIQDQVPDSLTKTRYELALIAELSSERTGLDPTVFATAFFKEQDRQPLLAHLEGRGVGPNRILKNNALISTALQRVQYEFQSGIRVLVQPDLVAKGDFVTIEDTDDGRTRLSILDELKRLRGAGR